MLDLELFTTKDARKKGVSASLLCYYAKCGLIESLGNGLYRSKQNKLPISAKYIELIIAIKSINNGVLCLNSALYVHKLIIKKPEMVYIAISNKTTKPIRDNVKFSRMRDIETGKITVIIGNQTIDTFNIERSIVDAFRNLSLDLALSALKKGVKANKVDIDKLRNYAKKMRVNIEPYIFAFTL